uniref:PH01B035L11.11 protein n=1 Tax=Phyllostachys edulis TaxID=38705 RepID=L0P1P8_PHYED|nr:PH01B035L11.11 [Phyllostachys edulis]
MVSDAKCPFAAYSFMAKEKTAAEEMKARRTVALLEATTVEAQPCTPYAFFQYGGHGLFKQRVIFYMEAALVLPKPTHMVQAARCDDDCARGGSCKAKTANGGATSTPKGNRVVRTRIS